MGFPHTKLSHMPSVYWLLNVTFTLRLTDYCCALFHMHSFIVSNDVADLVLARYQISNTRNKFIQIHFDDVIVIYIEIMGNKNPLAVKST